MAGGAIPQPLERSDDEQEVASAIDLAPVEGAVQPPPAQTPIGMASRQMAQVWRNGWDSSSHGASWPREQR
jgi:hypothetical protein